MTQEDFIESIQKQMEKELKRFQDFDIRKENHKYNVKGIDSIEEMEKIYGHPGNGPGGVSIEDIQEMLGGITAQQKEREYWERDSIITNGSTFYRIRAKKGSHFAIEDLATGEIELESIFDLDGYRIATPEEIVRWRNGRQEVQQT